MWSLTTGLPGKSHDDIFMFLCVVSICEPSIFNKKIHQDYCSVMTDRARRDSLDNEKWLTRLALQKIRQ